MYFKGDGPEPENPQERMNRLLANPVCPSCGSKDTEKWEQSGIEYWRCAVRQEEFLNGKKK